MIDLTIILVTTLKYSQYRYYRGDYMVDTQEAPQGDFIYDGVNGIASAIAAPGEWFVVDSNGLCFGVAFLAAVGTVIAALFITLGIA